MASIQSFEDLKVWQKSRLLCQEIFDLITTGKFAKDFALIDQINRSPGSIMDNIAEGLGRMAIKSLLTSLPILMALHSNVNRNYIGHLTENISVTKNQKNLLV